MKKTMLVLAVAALLVPAAGAAEAWFHVSVDGRGPEAEKVRVNIPLSLVEKLLPLVKNEDLQGGKLRMFECGEEAGIDFPALLKAVEEVQDGDFVTVQSTRQDVRVYKEKGYFFVKANRRQDKPETVTVKIPMSLARAFQPDARGEVDLAQVVRLLSEQQGEDLVTVMSDDHQVRIWIDKRQTID